MRSQLPLYLILHAGTPPHLLCSRSMPRSTARAGCAGTGGTSHTTGQRRWALFTRSAGKQEEAEEIGNVGAEERTEVLRARHRKRHK